MKYWSFSVWKTITVSCRHIVTGRVLGWQPNYSNLRWSRSIMNWCQWSGSWCWYKDSWWKCCWLCVSNRWDNMSGQNGMLQIRRSFQCKECHWWAYTGLWMTPLWTMGFQCRNQLWHTHRMRWRLKDLPQYKDVHWWIRCCRFPGRHHGVQPLPTKNLHHYVESSQW